MNKTWYECSVRYRKSDGDGVQKVVTETFLVDALSFTEAEARITEEIKAYISEEFKVTNIKVTNYSETIFDFESDYWFKAKVALIAYDEESGKEKKTNIYFLAQANTLDEAYDKIKESMKTTIGDYSIPSVSETKLMDVFPFVAEEVN